MVKLYALYTNDLKDPKEYQEMLEGFPVERKEKILRCRQVQARKQSFGAGLLLDHVLSLNGKRQEDITYTVYGKPEIPDLYFNLSHSQDIVICAVSDRPVGCDVEKMKGCHEDIAERFFSKNEVSYLNRFSGEEKTELFYRFWTLKESYVKMIGEGMHLSFDQFEITLEDDFQKQIRVMRDGEVCSCYLQEYVFPGYKIAICAEESDFSSKITFVEI